jgi:hypothetical protein
MTVTYNNMLRLADLATGTEVGTWGEITDVNVCQLLAQAITGISYVAITTNDASDQVLSALNGQVDEARSLGIRHADRHPGIIIPNRYALSSSGRVAR